MKKKILISAVATSMMLFLLSACAEDDQASSDAANAEATKTTQAADAKAPATARPNRPARGVPTQTTQEPRKLEAFQSAAVMSEPVDFSSPEQVTATMDKIKQDAGDEAANRLKNAMDYLLVYDLGVGRSQQKLNAKLNGKTPNEILAMINR